jgi:hypothetical protein
MCACLGKSDCVSCALRFIDKWYPSFFVKDWDEESIFNLRDGILKFFELDGVSA